MNRRLSIKRLLFFPWMLILLTSSFQATPLRIHVPTPVGVVSVDWETITNNPITSCGVVAIAAVVGYITQDYWLTPLAQYLKKRDCPCHTQHAKDNKKDEMKENALSDFQKSRAKIYKPGDIKTKLSDVAGLHAAKADMQDIMAFLKNPKAFTDMGAKIPKGVLMQGPPGNGKTLLAKAIAGEVNCPFISVCASEFIEMFVGAGAARIRDLFSKAKELAPCILFIDEFDAIGRKRSSMSVGGGGDEHAQTLGQLLTLMDGFDTQKNPIIVLAATNRAEVLDPAVLRPGRFDRIVEVGKPYLKDRIEILNVHLNQIKKADNIDVGLIAQATIGFSGAELANLVNEAAILAVQDKSSCVTMIHIDRAYDNITIGREIMSMDQNPEELWQTAIHEAGHSIVRIFLEHAEPLYKVTITPRGKALGISFARPIKEKYAMHELEMKDQIKVCLAGALAEKEFEIIQNTGRRNDLMKACNIAYAMVSTYGMSDELLYMNYEDIDTHLPQDVANMIHEQVRKIIEECTQQAAALVKLHREQIKALAELLMKEGTVFGNVVYEMCGVPQPQMDFSLVK
jgi:cell division protease FtsH